VGYVWAELLLRFEIAMKITTKFRYGLRVLLDLAMHASNKRPRMLKDIAKNQDISEKYLSLLAIKLRRAGFISSVRGAGGGYKLAKSPKMILLIDVFEVMEGPLAIVECLQQPDCCPRSKRCSAQILWAQINQQIRNIFAQYTLQYVLDLQHVGGFTEIDCGSLNALNESKSASR
jgi:Rrf2 family protein